MDGIHDRKLKNQERRMNRGLTLISLSPGLSIKQRKLISASKKKKVSPEFFLKMEQKVCSAYDIILIIGKNYPDDFMQVM